MLCGFVVLLQTVSGDNITIIDALRCVEARSWISDVCNDTTPYIGSVNLVLHHFKDSKPYSSGHFVILQLFFSLTFYFWQPGQRIVRVLNKHLKAYPDNTVLVQETKGLDSKRDHMLYHFCVESKYFCFELMKCSVGHFWNLTAVL